MALIKTAAEIWRKYVTDGVPASGANQPDKLEIILWGTFLESLLGAGSAGLAFTTLSALSADLAHTANSSAIVYNDPTAANNGLYVKSGGSGSGSWTRIGDLPNSVVRLTVTGGTANAIVATAPETPTAPGSKLYLMTPTGNNTGATTLAVNGGAAVAIKTALGSDLVTGSLINGSQVLMAWADDHYQLLISVPVDASGVLNDVLDARDDAEDAATSATASAAALGNQVHQYDTRAQAIAATVPAGVNFIRTLAYDSDFIPDSCASFRRVAAGTAFTDTWPTAGTIAGGSGYTNGTYYGISLSGSATGSGLFATITIAGGAVTAVDYYAMPGNSFKVGDVLTCGNASIGGTGSGFTYTITTISTPLASFVNTVDSSRWQYMTSKGFPHVNEFGAKADWIGVDASATNNFAPIQAALFFSVNKNFGTVNFDGGGFAGNIVRGGVGTYMLNHPASGISLIVPNGVYFEGMSGGTTLKFHNSWNAATHCVCIGNPNAHFANFRCGMRDVELFFSRGIAAAVGTYVVYSNNAQDGGGLDRVYIYSGQRGGLRYEIGYGGASTVHFHHLSINCEGPNVAVHFTVGTTLVDCQQWSLNAPSSGDNFTDYAVALTGTGGMYSFRGIHMEGFQHGFSLDLRSGNNPMASFKNVTGGLHLQYVFTIQSLSQAGRLSFEQCQRNNGLATGLIENGLGANRISDIAAAEGIVGY